MGSVVQSFSARPAVSCGRFCFLLQRRLPHPTLRFGVRHPCAVAKSAFGLYALYRTVKDGRPVVYDSRKSGAAVFKDNRAYAIAAKLDDVEDMHNPRTLYLCDGKTPSAPMKAFPLLITSPKKENWSEFEKTKGVALLILPVFTRMEIMELRRVAFDTEPGCSEAEVAERFDKWGGNARNVLTKGENEDWQGRLDTGPALLSLPQLEKSIVAVTSLSTVSDPHNIHRLIDLVPKGALADSSLEPNQKEFYAFHHAELPTPYVENLFADRMLAASQTELYRFLHVAQSDPSIAGFRGVLYERAIVFPALVRGAGSLRVGRLSPPWDGVAAPTVLAGASALDLRAPLKLVHFRSPEELVALWTEHKGDAVFVPRSKSQAVIDGVIRLAGQALLFNATVSESHDIKCENAAFVKVLKAVGLQPEGGLEAGEIPFIWVLPQDAYDTFTDPGSLKSAAGTTLASGQPGKKAINRRLAQFKMLLPVPDVTRASGTSSPASRGAGSPAAGAGGTS